MKNRSRSSLIIGLIISVLTMAMVAPVVAEALSVSVEQAFLGSLAIHVGAGAVYSIGTRITGKKPSMSGMAMAGINPEFWQNLIMENLFPDNSFLSRSHKVGNEFIIGGVAVHIPQAGAKPEVIKNRGVFPATAVERTDTDANYPLDSYSITPHRVRDLEKKEVSYDKAMSVLKEFMPTLLERLSNEFLYKWAVSLGLTSMVRTTGALDAAFLPHATATGTRRKFTKDDIRKARYLMNKQDIPKDGRVLLLPSEFYDQLMDDSTLLTRDTAREVDLKNGVVTRLYGFDVMERSDVLLATNAGTPVIQAVGAAEAATDNMTALAWQEDTVERAVGDVTYFENEGDALHYGDVYSGEVRAGGRRRRGDDKGVISIVQAAS